MSSINLVKDEELKAEAVMCPYRTYLNRFEPFYIQSVQQVLYTQSNKQ